MPLARDFAADDQFRAVPVLEERLDRGDGLTGPHEVGGRTSPEQEADGLDQNRLAGARLAGQRGEAAVELDLDGLDHREVADAQQAEHVGGTSMVSDV